MAKVGYLVIRACGKVHQALMGVLRRRGVECKEFDTKNDNIGELNSYLSRKPKEPIVVVIRGAMRAGMTIGDSSYIYAWVETPSSVNCDTPAQSGVGRACGYGRTKDTYPIYCDIASVDKAIAFYKDVESESKTKTLKLVPSGVQNKMMKPRLVRSRPFEAIVTYPEADEIRREIRQGSKKNRAQISRTSNNFMNPICRMALENRRDSGATIGLYVDGPPTKKKMEDAKKEAMRLRTWHKIKHFYTDTRLRELQADYKKLIKSQPELIGKVGLYGADVVIVESPLGSRNSYQRTKSALRVEK